MAQSRGTLRPQVPFSGRSNFKVGAPTGPADNVSFIADGPRPIRRIQAMTFSKLSLGVSLAAFVFCVFAVLGPSTGPLLADGAVAPRSFQSGGVSALEVTALSALPAPDRTLNSQATNKFSNNMSARHAHVVVQACKPSGAACSLPGECCSNSCVPPGFGGEPTCR
jgi:hypothetical protein